jgi:DNA-binding response OmpR family regulator
VIRASQILKSKQGQLEEVKMTKSARVRSKQERILYIENVEDSREMLALMLSDAGYKVATATDGLSLAMIKQFDLYILGSRFPDGTGVDLCRRIRAFDPGTPILFFSSAAYESDIKAGMDAGAQDYLTQPAGIYVIEQSITELLADTVKARA